MLAGGSIPLRRADVPWEAVFPVVERARSATCDLGTAWRFKVGECAPLESASPSKQNNSDPCCKDCTRAIPQPAATMRNRGGLGLRDGAALPQKDMRWHVQPALLITRSERVAHDFRVRRLRLSWLWKVGECARPQERAWRFKCWQGPQPAPSTPNTRAGRARRSNKSGDCKPKLLAPTREGCGCGCGSPRTNNLSASHTNRNQA